jgi:ribonucleoside-diphosphate reductase alpha chain
MSLQYGVPLEVYVNKFSHTRFEPMGFTKHPDIRIAKSIVDYIFRWMGLSFLPGYREATLGHVDSAGPAESAAGGSAEDAEAEPRPAAMKAGGPTPRPGTAEKQAANGHGPKPVAKTAAKPATTTAIRHDGNGNGSHAAKPKKRVLEFDDGHDKTDVLDRAGVRLKVDQNGGPLSNRTEQFARFQTDAPACENCGAITVRNGNCYLCHNCGNSMGCS